MPKEIITPFVLSFVLAYIATPLVIKLAKKIGIVDDPKKNKHPKVIHKYPVPRGGGIAIFASIIIVSLIFLPIDKHLIGILLGAFFVTLLGVLDDKFNISPYLRLFLQFVFAGIPIAFGIGISFIRIPFLADFISQTPFLSSIISVDSVTKIIDLSRPQISFELLGKVRSIWVLSDVFALFWIVGLMNMLNMGAKGVDGQLPGVTGISALTIAALSLRFSADITQWPVIILAIIMSGAYFGFLPWNFYPQKIMPSYSGSTLAGYLLGVLSILSTAKVGTILVVLGVPLIDTAYVVAKRVFSGKSPVWGDATHLHHRLLKLGWGKRRVPVFYWTATAILGLLALNLNASQKLYTIIGIAALLGWLFIFLNKKNEGN